MEFYFKQGYCVQKCLDTANLSQNILKVILNKGIQEHQTINLPSSFIDWNKKARLEMLNAYQEGKHSMGGPHCAMVATCGAKQADNLFSLNNAAKGVGFLPNPEKIDYFVDLFQKTNNASFAEKIDILQDYYLHLEDNCTLNCLVSLELYTNTDFSTQTFRNQMHNPESCLTFLDIPSFKLKTFACILDPANPDLTVEERKITKFVNLLHGYFHGSRDKMFLTVIYYVSQVFTCFLEKNYRKGMHPCPENK